MRIRYSRLLTAVVIIGVSWWPVWEGTNVIRYSRAVTKSEIRQWTSVPGVASSAAEDALTYVDDTSDAETIIKRRDELADILEKAPLSSLIWLKFAEARVSANDPASKVLEAFDLSALTGPNEGYMITQRGLFGIWQWERLPPAAKTRTINDLSTSQISDTKLAWLKTTLSEKTEPVRQEIRKALQAQGFSEKNLARLGLN